MAALRVLLLVVIAVLGGLAGLWFGSAWRLPAEQQAPAGVTPARPGDRVAALTLPGLDGRMQPLRAGSGRPQLINVWATWCAPCIKEMPVLDAFSVEQGDNGVEVVGIALDDPDAVRAFLAHLPVRYRIVLDTPGPADSSVWLGNTRGVLPYSVLIDGQGRVVRQYMGELSKRQLNEFARLD